MKSINKSKLRRVLNTKLGCVTEPKKRHECYRVIIDGKFVAQTFMSRGSKKSINNTLMKRMAVQLNVNLPDFKEFCACDIDREEFEKLILEGAA